MKEDGDLNSMTPRFCPEKVEEMNLSLIEIGNNRKKTYLRGIKKSKV